MSDEGRPEESGRVGGRLSKRERIVSQKLTDRLFSGGQSQTLAAFPLRAVYMQTDRQAGAAPVQIMVSVPKRKLHHAVDRNRVKRQVREAYRRQKTLLTDRVSENQQVAVAFLWLSDRLYTSAEIDSRMKSLLERINLRTTDT